MSDDLLPPLDDDADEQLAKTLARRAPRQRSKLTTALVLVLVLLVGVFIGIGIGRGSTDRTPTPRPSIVSQPETTAGIGDFAMSAPGLTIES